MVFSRLKFEKSLLLLLFSFIFHSKMIVHIAERAKQNILLKIIYVKLHSSMWKLLLDFPAAVINFSPFRELQVLEMITL